MRSCLVLRFFAITRTSLKALLTCPLLYPALGIEMFFLFLATDSRAPTASLVQAPINSS